MREELRFVGVGAKVAWRRVFLGPKHPSWNWLTEALAETLRVGIVASLAGAPAGPERWKHGPPPPGHLGDVPALELGDPQSPRTLLYFHGGGYTSGSALEHRPLIDALTQAAQAHTFAIDYRLAPAHPFPAAVDDALAAYRALLARDVPPAQIVLAGESAGGGLAVACALAAARENLASPAGLLLLSPWLDLGCTAPSLVDNTPFDWLQPSELRLQAKAYLGGRSVEEPLASPVHASLAGLPPVLVQVGGGEVLLDDSTRFAERLRTAGVEVGVEIAEGLFHGYHFHHGLLPDAKVALASAGAFVRRVAQSRS